MDANYQPDEMEYRTLFGLKLEQKRNDALINADTLKNVVTKTKDLPSNAIRDMIIAQIALVTQAKNIENYLNLIKHIFLFDRNILKVTPYVMLKMVKLLELVLVSNQEFIALDLLVIKLIIGGFVNIHVYYL
jgi:hypothetical protein